MASNTNSVTASDLLVPVLLMAVTLFLSMGFQAVQILHDRDSLNQFIAQQDKPLEDSHKLQAQLSALALGTKKLADGGDKNAAAIVTRMQQLGITIGDKAPAEAAPQPAPAPAQP